MLIFYINGTLSTAWDAKTYPDCVSLMAFVKIGLESSFDLFDAPLVFLAGDRGCEPPFAGDDTELDFLFPLAFAFAANLLISFRLCDLFGSFVLLLSAFLLTNLC